jgi:hypothetical protein
MPFYLGERVNLRFEGDPATARLTIGTTVHTVHNGGLEAQRDGGLIAVVQLPSTVGEVDYVFTDASEIEQTGKLRVIGERRTTLPGADETLAEPTATVTPAQHVTAAIVPPPVPDHFDRVELG